MAESIIYLFCIAYFLYISKNWVWLQIPNIILCILGVAWVLWLPETPRYLFAKKRYSDARLCFAKVAYLNNKDVSIWKDVIFDTEAEELEDPELLQR